MSPAPARIVAIESFDPSRDHSKDGAASLAERDRAPRGASYNIAMNRKTRIQPIDAAQDDGESQYDRPSKSQLKREMHALQELGQALIELPKDALKRMPMPESLDEAVREARRITDHEGKRRQLQYVGKVMRSLTEEEIAALRTALDTYRGVNKAETARLHWIERTREQLLDRDEALTEFIQKHPGVDVQEARTLIRNARKEREQQKPPRYYRELFQWIKNAAGVDDEEENGGDEDDRDDDEA
jgi:ribosome-associated protein